MASEAETRRPIQRPREQCGVGVSGARLVSVWPSTPHQRITQAAPLGGNNDTISSQYQGPDITSRGWPRGGAPPLGRPLQPIGRPWKRPGPPPELQKRVRRAVGTDGASAVTLVLSTTATTAHRQPACPLLTSTEALPTGCRPKSRTR